MRDILAAIGAGCVMCFLSIAAWITCNEVSQRNEVRRAARAQKPGPPVIGYLAEEINPHPDKHPTLHVDADTADEAWAAISRRGA